MTGAGAPSLLAVDALATFRLTRLVTEDYLTARPRERFIRHAYLSAGKRLLPPALDRAAGTLPYTDTDPPKLAVLITCPWCSGVWVAAGVVLARHLAPTWWHPLSLVLAFSAVAGLLAEVVG